jgi:hypothetical protein
MAGSSEKKAILRRITQYRLFGSLALILNFIYFHRVFLSFVMKDVLVEWIPSLVELIGVLMTQIHYVVCIMARAGDIGGEKADSWGLDYFVLTGVTQMIKLFTKSFWVYVFLLVLPLHTVYSFKGIIGKMGSKLGG